MESPRKRTVADTLSNQQLSGYLGGPTGTVEEFLTTLGTRVLEPGMSRRIHFLLPPKVAGDHRVVEALLKNEGNDLRECISVLGAAERLTRTAGTPELDEQLKDLNENTREAVRLMGACPEEVAWRYDITFALAAIGMSLDELEVFHQLVKDRAGEIVHDSYSDPDIISESAELVRVLVT